MKLYRTIKEAQENEVLEAAKKSEQPLPISVPEIEKNFGRMRKS